MREAIPGQRSEQKSEKPEREEEEVRIKIRG